jgi:hypothetical protein
LILIKAASRLPGCYFLPVVDDLAAIANDGNQERRSWPLQQSPGAGWLAGRRAEAPVKARELMEKLNADAAGRHSQRYPQVRLGSRSMQRSHSIRRYSP